MLPTRWIVFSLIALVLVTAAGLNHLRSPTAAANPSALIQEGTPSHILNHVRNLHSPLVLVNFWASWCEPCKVEFPNIMSLRHTFAAQGLRVVFVSVDETADRATAESFLKEQKVDFPTFYKGSQSLAFVSQIYPNWSGAVPATLLLGPDLQILDAWEGDTSLEEFHNRIERQLKGS